MSSLSLYTSPLRPVRLRRGGAPAGRSKARARGRAALRGGDGAQVLYVPGVGGAHLQDEYLRARVGGQDGKRKADLVVQVSCRRGDTLPGVPENRREGVLGRRLAHRSRDADDGGRRRILAQ